MSRGPGPVDLVLDGHVHFHPFFDVDEFLERGWRNLGEGAEAAGHGVSGSRVLLLADPGADDPLRPFARWNGRWEIDRTAEEESRLARIDALEIFLVAGRQIRTSDGLEILALCTSQTFANERPFEETLAGVRAGGALPVVPWGFGKWWGRRGRLLERALLGGRLSGVYLGDSVWRPRWPRPPRLFRLARRMGVGILPGSDPLPLPGQVESVGSAGGVVRGTFDRDRPSDSVRRLLLEERVPVEPLGRRASVAACLAAQLRLRAGRSKPA